MMDADLQIRDIKRMHGPDPVCRYSHKLSVSVKNWLPRITLRRSYSGLYV